MTLNTKNLAIFKKLVISIAVVGRQYHRHDFFLIYQIGSCHVNALDTSERETRMLKFGTCHLVLGYVIFHLCLTEDVFSNIWHTIYTCMYINFQSTHAVIEVRSTYSYLNNLSLFIGTLLVAMRIPKWHKNNSLRIYSIFFFWLNNSRQGDNVLLPSFLLVSVDLILKLCLVLHSVKNKRQWRC